MTNNNNEFKVNCRNQSADAREADTQTNFTHLYHTPNAKLSNSGHFKVHIFTVRFTECMSCKLLDYAAPTTRVGYKK